AYADLDQIKKSNVQQLDVAWNYPYASPGFNPVVVDDVVYTAGRNGSLVALDAATGKEIWIHEGLTGMTGRGVNFWASEDGNDTWPPVAYLYAGGVNNWGSMSVDDEHGIVYIPTGSSTYDFYGADRVGQDVYVNCLLALDARTGKRLWHFQTVHHDLWD